MSWRIRTHTTGTLERGYYTIYIHSQAHAHVYERQYQNLVLWTWYWNFGRCVGYDKLRARNHVVDVVGMKQYGYGNRSLLRIDSVWCILLRVESRAEHNNRTHTNNMNAPRSYSFYFDVVLNYIHIFFICHWPEFLNFSLVKPLESRKISKGFQKNCFFANYFYDDFLNI